MTRGSSAFAFRPRFLDVIPTLAISSRALERRVQALSTQKSSNVTVTLAEGIGLSHYPQLVLRGKASTLRLLNHFGILDPRRSAAGGIESIKDPPPEVTGEETSTKLKNLQIKLEAETHEKLKQAQTQLIQSEKMAALGKLVAGIEHHRKFESIKEEVTGEETTPS